MTIMGPSMIQEMWGQRLNEVSKFSEQAMESCSESTGLLGLTSFSVGHLEILENLAMLGDAKKWRLSSLGLGRVPERGGI